MSGSPAKRVVLTVAPKPRRKLKSSYGSLAHLRAELENIDFAEIRREMTDEPFGDLVDWLACLIVGRAAGLSLRRG